MSRRELERTGARDRQTSRLESRVAELGRDLADRATALESGALAGARVLTGVALTTTVTEIDHGLGRAWSGAWIVQGDPAGATLATSKTANDSRRIGLALSSGTATVDVAVF